MCNLDKFLAAVRHQVELIAEFELTRKTPPKKKEEKKTGANDRHKFKKDDDKAEGGADEARKHANKQKSLMWTRRSASTMGDPASTRRSRQKHQ